MTTNCIVGQLLDAARAKNRQSVPGHPKYPCSGPQEFQDICQEIVSPRYAAFKF